jgi:preprotein translocase subunit SecE
VATPLLDGGVLAVKRRRRNTLAEKDKKGRRSENAIQRYFRETIGELKKVTWPTWPEARRLTGLVLLVMVVVGLFLASIDALAGSLLTLVLGT